MTTYVVPEEVKRKLKRKPPSFCGGFDTDVITLNGDVMRLHVFGCPTLKNGESFKVKVKILELDRYFNEQGRTVDEGSDDDTIGEFEGFLHNRNGKFFFSDMKPSRPINWSETAPYPWFRLTFARETDKVTVKSDNSTDAETFPVVIGKNDEPAEEPRFEIGFLITKEDGTVIGNQQQLVSHFYGVYSYRPFLDLFDIHTQLDSVNLLNITNAQIKYAPTEPDDDEELVQSAVASTTQVYDSTIDAYNRKKLKAIDKALKAIDKLIRESKNPWFQHIQAVNEYYRKLEEYRGLVEQYNKMQNSSFSTQGDCYTLENAMIRPLVQELNRLEEDIHQYLKNSSKPPKAYIDRIDRNISILKRNKKIDKILNNPAVQMMGLLPGAGVVTGVLKLIQGNYFDGFLDVFGAITSYGSFLKLSRVARAYRKSSKATVEMLYSYRYRKLVSSITGPDVMNKITETSLKHSGTFLGNLFDTVGTFKSLRGHVDSIALLHRNREYIVDMTQKAIRGIKMGMITDADSYLIFLKDLRNANAAAEFFAHIRVLHATVKGGKDAYTVTLEAMDDVQKLLGFQQLPGVEKFDMEVVENTRTLFRMMNERRFKIQEIIDTQTAKFGHTSSIIEHFNESLADYDMFGVNRNADVRYQNTRAEMLLAIDEICDLWESQKKEREKWVEEKKKRCVNKYLPELQIQWAKKTKTSAYFSLPKPLETRIANFIQKLEGQIILREMLPKEITLGTLKGIVDSATAPDTNVIYDFNSDEFLRHGTNLVKKYY